MNATTFAALRRGIEAGLVASVPQVLGTHLHGKILGFSPGSANLGPRLIERLGKLTSRRPSEETRWLGSASFHFVYSAGWGALYALAYQHRPVHPVVGGLLLSGTIYADRKSTRLNSSHVAISYAVFCLKKTTRPLV